MAEATAVADPWRVLGRRPLLFSLLGAALLGLTGVLFDEAHVSPATATVFRCLYALPLIAAFARFERRRGGRWDGSRPLAWAAGLMLAADLVVWQRSIRDVGAGLATVLGNTQLLFVVVVSATLLGERVTVRVAFASATMLVGVLLISGALESHPFGAHPARGVAYAVSGGALYAGYILLMRSASGAVASVRPLLHATCSATAGAVVLGLALGELRLTPSWPAHGWLALMAILCQALAWLLLTVPIGKLPASATSVALSLQPVSAMAYGALLLGERPSALQTVGVAVVLAGFVVATGQRSASGRAPNPAVPDDTLRDERYAGGHA